MNKNIIGKKNINKYIQKFKYSNIFEYLNIIKTQVTATFKSEDWQ